MDETKNSRFMAGWGLPASVIVHLFALILVIFGLPVDLLQTEEQQAIEVSLVPPPAQEEKAKAEPPPPPPPPAKAPEEPKQPEAASAPPTDAETPQQTPSDPIINPVFQFGEKDSGPRESLEGNAAEEGSETAEPTEQPAETANARQEQETATEQPADDASDTVEEASSKAAPSEADKSEAAKSEADREPEEKSAEAQSILSASRSDDQASPVEELAKPAEKPPEKAKPKAEKKAPKKAAKLQKAKTLYSRAVTGNPAAMTAMRNMPRDIRAGRLCVTELREQLLNAWPPYVPDLLPTERLRSGTVLDGSGAAFRQAGQWYELNFRCEVDKDAMRVVSFAFSVGDRLSQSERMRRGLPLQ